MTPVRLEPAASRSQALYTAEPQRSLPFRRVSRYLQWYVFDFESELPIQNLVTGANLRRQVGLFVFLKNMLFFLLLFFVCFFFENYSSIFRSNPRIPLLRIDRYAQGY